MSWFSRLWNHARSNDVSREIDREMAFHLDERVDDLVAAGMPADVAKREARRRFGNVTAQKERTRDRDLFAWLDTLIGDLRYALRSLRAAPAFTLVAILSLGLGIGANTAIFTIVNAVMLKSLPVSHPEELVAVMRDKDSDVYTNPLWEAIRDRQDVFSGLFAFSEANFNLTNGGEARRIDGTYVSGRFFSTLGVRPAIGRLLAEQDDHRGCPATTVLSNGFWRSEFGGDPAVVGKTISFDGHPFSIIGVAGEGFTGVNVGAHPQAYVPLCSIAVIQGPDNALDKRSYWMLQIIGRPKPGVTAEQIAARLNVAAPAIVDATMPPDWPPDAMESYRKTTFSTIPAERGFSDLRTTYKKALYILMAIVALVLLVACANVANLLLARATTRQREMAVRLALGAGRARLARQLITESLLLSCLGAALGIVVALWGSRVLVELLSRSNQTVALDLRPDGHVLVFTLAVAVATGVLFGLAPAWRAGRVDPQAAMKAQGRGLTEGRGRARFGKMLVAAQIALSLVLVAGAGLLLGSWRRLATTDRGFRAEQVLLVTADIQPMNVPGPQRYELFEQALARIRAVPGVRSASSSEITPIGRSAWNEMLKIDGYEPKSKKDAVSWANAVSDRYFSTLGIPMLAGRDFSRTDTKSSAKVAIVSEAMAKRFFGTANVVGRTFRTQDGKDFGSPIEIVGVVGTTKYRSLRDSAQPIIYFPGAQQSSTRPRQNFEIRAEGQLSSVTPALRAAFAQIDQRIVLDFTSLERQVNESMTVMRTVSSLSAVFGGLALLLATIGLYGLMAYGVARRRNEIGVRIALGAGRARVVRMVLGDVSRIIVVGVTLGIALSFLATKLVATFLYGVKPNDPSTLGASALVLAAVGLLAAALPALRASRLDPVAALRED